MNKKLQKALCLMIAMAMTCVAANAAGKIVSVKSPNGAIEIKISADKSIDYKVLKNGEELLGQKGVTMQLADRTLGENAKLKSAKKTSARGTLKPVVALKHAEVANNYNGVVLAYGDFSVEFRAFDNGVAYRFATKQKGDIEVMNESFNMTVSKPMTAHLQQPNGFQTSCEELYTHMPVADWKPQDKMSELPVLFSDEASDLHILISESDLHDYPGMFLKGDGKGGMTSVFAPCPLKQEDSSDRQMRVVEAAKYIAKTSGTRTFPWRFAVITDSKGLVEQNMAFVLATQPDFDTSWIKPCQVSWDWWNHKAVWGPDVDFNGGVNTATYKYFIDFASKYGIASIILDEGWAKTTADVLETIPEIDLPELIRYGNSKNVKLILWLPWLAVEHHNWDFFDDYEKMGIAGCKIDFMDRQDQYMVNFYEKTVAEAAKHHLLIDFHGAYKPSGLEVKYPNLLSYEGVRGMEYNEYCDIDNTLYYPYIRNAVGPMDFTPGAMNSVQPDKNARTTYPDPKAFGTRAYQMALYTVFESGIQMLSDTPSRYYKEPECTKFISQVPVTWDDTRALAAKVGEYVIVAKRKGAKWYVAGICNGKQTQREFSVPLDFLSAGEYTMTAFEDGYNAARVAIDYKKTQKQVNSQTVLTVKMARNGGFTAVIE